MSSATLLKKTRAKFNISGRSKNAKMGLHGPYGKGEFTSGSGGGFSLNGPHRNKGRVGKNSLFSPVRSQNLVQVATSNGNVSVRKGWGGYNGQYSKGNPALFPVNTAPVPNTPCCDDVSNISKPSVLNTKGMLAYKNRWKKTNTKYGTHPGQIQTIYNNWVKEGTSNNYNMTRSSGQHTQKLAVTNGGCIPGNMDQNAGKKTCNAKNVNGSKVKCGHHIGGKYIPSTPYAKSSSTPSSSVALNNYINARAGLNPYGWQKSFPVFLTNNGQCSGFVAKQATDSIVLQNYYQVNANDSIPPRPCRKLPHFNPQNGKGCYYKVPGSPDKSGCPP